MIRRPPRSTQSRSSAASDVYKRQLLGSQEHQTAWATPGSVSPRADAYTSGGGSVTEAVADSNGARYGAVAGTTATSKLDQRTWCELADRAGAAVGNQPKQATTRGRRECMFEHWPSHSY